MTVRSCLYIFFSALFLLLIDGKCDTSNCPMELSLTDAVMQVEEAGG